MSDRNPNASDVAILGELRQCGDLYERARLVPATPNLSMDSAPTALPMVPVSITMARRLTSGILGMVLGHNR